MSYGENRFEKPKLPEQLSLDESEKLFVDRVETLSTRANALKVKMHYAVEIDGAPVFGSDHVVFGASIGKLPLAEMAINTLDHDTTWRIDDSIRDSSGGGELDRLVSVHEATTIQLLDDMLRNSGNTAYRVLARGLGGPDEINQYYADKWRMTHVDTDSKTGRAVLGETTPTESLAQLKAVISGESGNARLREGARLALRNNASQNRGIRKFITSGALDAIYNKTGEYNGDEDDPLVFRHDVGLVEGPEKTVGYAIMTTSPRNMRKVHRTIANTVVSQFGAEVARVAGGPDVVKLGARALRFAL